MTFPGSHRWRSALIAVATLLVTASFSSIALADGFDKPLRQTVLDLGPSPDQPDFPNLHRHVSCYYFPHFMVKQLDYDGNKGALWVSITPLQPRQLPSCNRAHLIGERLIGKKLEKYFEGVKGQLVFLISADGLNGAMYFWAFDSRYGKKVFDDSFLAISEADFSRRNSYIDFSHNSNGHLILKYQRVFEGDCSVPKDGAVCWAKFQKQSGLKDAPMPKCDYSSYPDDSADPSVIFYPVEVDLFPQPKTSVLSNAVKCLAAE